MIAGGDDIVELGSTIVLRNVVVPADAYGSTNTIESTTLEIVDLADPDHPTHTSLAMPAGAGHTGLLTDGTDVLTSHWSPVPFQPDKVRFFVDRVGLAAPTAPMLWTVNVPGSLVADDAVTGRVLTARYERVVTSGIAYDTCQTLFGYNAEWQSDDPDTWTPDSGTCTGLHRTLSLVELDGSFATVLSEGALDDRASVGQPLAGDDRVFFGYEDYYYYGAYDDVGGGWGGGIGPKVIVVGGLRGASLRIASASLSAGDSSYATAVSGKKLVLESYSPPGLSVLDATNLSSMSVERVAILDGYPNSVTMMGDVALCSLDEYGLDAVDLSP